MAPPRRKAFFGLTLASTDPDPLPRPADSLPAPETQEQEENEVQDDGGEADKVEAALLDALALIGGGRQGVYHYLCRDLEVPPQSINAARKAVQVLVYTRVDESQMGQYHEDNEHEYRPQQRHRESPLSEIAY